MGFRGIDPCSVENPCVIFYSPQNQVSLGIHGGLVPGASPTHGSQILQMTKSLIQNGTKQSTQIHQPQPPMGNTSSDPWMPESVDVKPRDIALTIYLLKNI